MSCGGYTLFLASSGSGILSPNVMELWDSERARLLGSHTVSADNRNESSLKFLTRLEARVSVKRRMSFWWREMLGAVEKVGIRSASNFFFEPIDGLDLISLNFNSLQN